MFGSFHIFFQVNQTLFLSGHVVSRAPADLHYVEWSILQKVVKAHKDWNLERGVKSKYEVMKTHALSNQKRRNEITCESLTETKNEKFAEKFFAK